MIRHSAVVDNGHVILPAYRTITFDLVNGHFIDVVEGTENWQSVAEGLPRCLELTVDLARVIAEPRSVDTVLWAQ